MPRQRTAVTRRCIGALISFVAAGMCAYGWRALSEEGPLTMPDNGASNQIRILSQCDVPHDFSVEELEEASEQECSDYGVPEDKWGECVHRIFMNRAPRTIERGDVSIQYEPDAPSSVNVHLQGTTKAGRYRAPPCNAVLCLAPEPMSLEASGAWEDQWTKLAPGPPATVEGLHVHIPQADYACYYIPGYGERMEYVSFRAKYDSVAVSETTSRALLAWQVEVSSLWRSANKVENPWTAYNHFLIGHQYNAYPLNLVLKVPSSYRPWEGERRLRLSERGGGTRTYEVVARGSDSSSSTPTSVIVEFSSESRKEQRYVWRLVLGVLVSIFMGLGFERLWGLRKA